MKPIFRNTIAVIAGWIIGVMLVNGAIVQMAFSSYPANINTQDMGAISNFLETASVIYILYPFFAHAAGTLVGGFVAGLISKNLKYGTALIVGGISFLGGLIMTFIISAPFWFIALDLIVAYFPMALLGAFIARKLIRKN